MGHTLRVSGYLQGLSKTMDSKKVHIKSFGCQMNKLDTALVTSALKEAGYALTDSQNAADVILINTCSVRQHAEEKVFSYLGNLKNVKRLRPAMVVGVIGCMAQRLGNELFDNEAVDIVCGPTQIPQIVKLIENAKQKQVKKLAISEKIREKAAESESRALEDFESVFDSDDKPLPGQAFVRVMRGCNNFCSYCVVPYVRGQEVSREPKRIIEQVKRLADDGVKQITLLGQAVNAYKYRNSGKVYSLADLLYMVSEIAGVEWIKFVTSYPQSEFYDDICEAMACLPKVCKYLHMPAQSGSDRILKAMNRKYTASQYLELVQKAREKVDGIYVAGDFIVGFPGESKKDFEETVSLVEQVRYKNCFVFKYSPRPGTAAGKKLEDTVSIEVKKERNYRLLAVQEKISDELSREFLDREVNVLVEGLSKKPHLNASEGGNRPQLVGRTAEDWIVVFNGSESLAGKFVKVKITKTSPLTLFGELTEPRFLL